MTPDQLDILRVTLRELRREPAAAAHLFYCTLLRKHPRLEPVLGSGFDLEGKRLFWVLSAVVAALADPQRFIGLLTLLSLPDVREHLDDRQCVDAIGDALQCMLTYGLGEYHVAEVEEAWLAAYQSFASTVAHA